MATSDQSDLTELGAAERHRAVAAGFTAVAREVRGWDAPTPIDGWVARDVVDHLTGWFPAFLAAGGVELHAGSAPDGDPLAAWQAQTGAVQALLDDPDRSAEDFIHPRAGTHRLETAIDTFYTADVFMHTWDLARTTGGNDGLDPALCVHLLEGMEPIEHVMRSSGQYGPRVPAPDDADPVTRLIAFIGRDPDWQPPG